MFNEGCLWKKIQSNHRISVSQRLRQRDIALAANVSISTVSRVLNNVDGISQNIRERVLKAAANLGYQAGEEKLKSVHPLLLIPVLQIALSIMTL